MKVIFLDFDGVLNSEKYISEHDECGVTIDPTRMALLKQIVKATDARIVLSSSWRVHWDENPTKCSQTGTQIHALFAAHGLQIFDKTPKLRARREEEIHAWLCAHPQVRAFVVLDDALLSAEFLKGHFIKTANHFDGLDETDVKKAIALLTD